MEVTYDYYRIFYYAAKYKSFSQAATILMSNQPNVTRAIHNLESQLGCRLFIRSNRGAELTPEGERLYSHVAIAYDHLHAAELELENEKKLEQGTVTIGVSEIALHLLLHFRCWESLEESILKSDFAFRVIQHHRRYRRFETDFQILR